MLPEAVESGHASRKVEASKLRRVENSVAKHWAVGGNEVDDAWRKAGLFEELVHEVV